MATSIWGRVQGGLAKVAALAVVAGSAGHLIACWGASQPRVPRPVWLVVALLAMLWHHYRARVHRQADSMALEALKGHERWQAALAALVVLGVLNMALGAPLAMVSNWLTQDDRVRQAEAAKERAWAEVSAAKANAVRRAIEAPPAGPSSPAKGKAVPAAVQQAPHGLSAPEPPSVGAGRDAEEAINRWGTLFAWLLAVLAIVLSVVSSWIVGLLKDAREQVAQARADRGLDRQQIRLLRAMQVHDAVLAVQRLHAITDPDSPDRQFLRLVDEVLAHIGALRHKGADKVGLEKRLGMASRTLSAVLQSLESPVEARRLLQHEVLPTLRAVLDDAQESDLLRDDAGRRVVDALGGLVRVLEDA